MDTKSQEPFSNKEKVTILLHEYDKLCQEIHNRTSNGFQLLFSVGVALFVWLVAQQKLDWRFLTALGIGLLTLLVGGWVIFRDIKKAAARLRDLENDINLRADEELLVWETKCGGAVTGYWGRAKPLQDKTKQIERK
jgi:hypothetical protein